MTSDRPWERMSTKALDRRAGADGAVKAWHRQLKGEGQLPDEAWLMAKRAAYEGRLPLSLQGDGSKPELSEEAEFGEEAPPAEVVKWVASRLALKDVEKSSAPGPTAWALLQWAKIGGNQQEFWKWYVQLAKLEGGGAGGGWPQYDGDRVVKVIAKLERALKREERDHAA